MADEVIIDAGIVMRLKDRFSEPMKKANAGFKSIAESAKVANQHVKNIGASMQKIGSVSSKLGKTLTLAVTAPIQGFGYLALKASSDIEQLEISFESMTGSAEAGKKVLSDLMQFSEVTPFSPEQVTSSAKALMGFGVDTGQLTEKLTLLGDISAGSGKDINELASIFGKVFSKGHAEAETLNQLSEAGIPIIKELSKQYGLTAEQIFEATSNGALSFNTLEGALKNMTASGGIFENQMQKQSQTIAGLFSTLQGRVSQSLAVFGKSIKEAFNLKELIPKIGDAIFALVDKFKSLSPEMRKFIVIGGFIVALIPPALILFGALASAVGALTATFGLLTFPIVAIIAGVTLLAAFMVMAYQKSQKFRDAVGELGRVLMIIIDPLIQVGKYLFELIGFSTEGTAFFDGLATAVSVFAKGLELALTPLRLIVELFKHIKENGFNFGSIGNAISNIGTENLNIGKGIFNDLTGGGEQSTATASGNASGNQLFKSVNNNESNIMINMENRGGTLSVKDVKSDSAKTNIDVMTGSFLPQGI